MPKGTSRRGDFVLCILSSSFHIYGTWRNIYVGREFKVIMDWGQTTKGWDHFLLRKLTLETPSKDFDLAIGGGIGWMKWLKNGGRRKVLYFIQ